MTQLTCGCAGHGDPCGQVVAKVFQSYLSQVMRSELRSCVKRKVGLG